MPFIIDHLPEVNKCCFCISLKVGTILIAICGLLFVGMSAYASVTKGCDHTGTVQKIMGYSAFVVLAIQIMVFVTSIVLLVGICTKKPSTATWFMYAVILSIIVNLGFFILSLVAGLTDKECKFPFVNVISAIIQVIVWMYFLSVVKSYQSDM